MGCSALLLAAGCNILLQKASAKKQGTRRALKMMEQKKSFHAYVHVLDNHMCVLCVLYIPLGKHDNMHFTT